MRYLPIMLNKRAYRGFRNFDNTFLKMQGPLSSGKRHLFGAVFRTAVRIVKFPVLVFSAGTGSAYVVGKKIDDINEKFPYIERFRDYIPEKSTLDTYEKRLMSEFQNAKEFVTTKSDAMGESIGETKKCFMDFFLNKHSDWISKESPENATVHSTRVASASSPPEEGNERSQRLKEMHDEIAKAKAEYVKSLEDLKKENEELRKHLLLRAHKTSHGPQINKSLIDMYSEVLDELSHLDASYNVQDQLPRVVVIGDQSAGKTSVLEMIAQARIFPRGSGEMMTRSPVQVTLSEGAYHVASFKDSPAREYDLTKESELAALRAEIERRMTQLVSNGKTISTDVISLSVKGPGLQRMVLVDLPGIISTVTTGMDPEARSLIRKLAKDYMSNPNAIILCIQDGSIDAERSNVTELVSSVDPAGKRTIFVLTKVDLAEANLYNPNRIKQILEGRLFPMKALGYFAVVTGRGQKDETIKDIQAYEEEFFRKSRLFKEGTLRLKQMTTGNLSQAVAERFWKTVRDSVEQQADTYRAIRYNLETEWKNTFPGVREIDREGLFERGRNEILDDLSDLSNIALKDWEKDLETRLQTRVDEHIFEQIYCQAGQLSDFGAFMTKVEIMLKEWVENHLPNSAIATGCEALYFHLNEISKRTADRDTLFDEMRHVVYRETRRRHNWDSKASDRLKVIQTSALEDRIIQNKTQWMDTINFMEQVIQLRVDSLEQRVNELKGPNWKERWTRWVSRSEEEKINLAIVQELDTLLTSQENLSLKLSGEDLTMIRRNLNTRHSMDLDEKQAEKTVMAIHSVLVRREMLQRALSSCKECKKGFFYYQQGLLGKDKTDLSDCRDVLLFARIHRVLLNTVQALRQQIVNEESGRMEVLMKDVLEEISQDPVRMKELLKGKRVQLAEDLKRIRHIQGKLEEFIGALNVNNKE